MSKLVITSTLLAVALLGQTTQAADRYTPNEAIQQPFKGFAQGFLEQYCFDCHDDETTKGNLSLENLGPVDETNAAIWKSVWAQVTLQEMPPKRKPQPEIVDRLRMSDWIVGELQRSMADKGGFTAHLDPNKGNYFDHDLLFGPLPEEIQLKPTA